MKEFRKLRADEIECRVSTINEKGLTLLLYKDARVDMNMLDEVVGPENWSCHYEDHKGTLFCSVGIKVGGEWVWKEDAGAPSNMESQKGEASDAFKRACFRWGIGRELYTAPFVWVPAGNYKAEQKGNKWTTYDRFEVTDIGYDESGICRLKIVNQKGRKAVFELGSHNSAPGPEKPVSEPSISSLDHITAKDWNVLKGACKAKDMSENELLERYQIAKPSDITYATFYDMLDFLS